MMEYEKLLFEDTKRKETQKALTEIKLGLFEQKEEEKFDFSTYTKMTYGKKYKGLYDLYQNNETFQLVMVCPLIENNKNDYNERKDLEPYGYDCLYLEYLDQEAYALVLEAAIHERSFWINFFYYFAGVLYILGTTLALGASIYYIIQDSFLNSILICGGLWGGIIVSTILFPILLMKYRKFKAN